MDTLVTPRQIDLRLLGSPEVRVDGEPLDVDTRKAVALLAYLVAEQPLLTRQAALGLLWPESSEQRARGALRRTLSALRRGLGGGLVTDRETISLDPDLTVRFDEAELERIEQEHAHDDPCGECRPALGAAVRLFRGEFMEGFALRGCPDFEMWQLERGEHLRRRLGAVLGRLAAAHAAEGDHDAASTVAERLVDLDRLDESAWTLLMRLQAWQGERTRAIESYRRCVEVLDRELGVAPLETTTELMESIVDGNLPAPHHHPISHRIPTPTDATDALREQILDAVAVAGAWATLRVVREVSGRSEDAIVAAVDVLRSEGELVESPDGVFEFADGARAEAVYRSMRLARRRALHARAASVLPGGAQAEIARHLELAGLLEDAANAWLTAARTATAEQRHADALRHLEAALGTGVGDVASVHEMVGDLHRLGGRYGEAVAAYQRSASHGSSASIEAKLGSVYGRAGRWQLAEHHLLAAAAEASGDAAAPILVDLGVVLARRGRIEEAMARRAEALRLAPADRRVLAHAAFLAGMVDLERGQTASAEASLRQAAAVAEQLEDQHLIVAAMSNLGRVLEGDDRHEEAIEATRRAVAAARVVGDRHAEAAALTGLGDQLRAAGRGDEAAEAVLAAVALLAHIGLDSDRLDPEIWALTGW